MTFKTKLVLFAISSSIILLFVFGLYFYKFALLGLSNNQELWEQFGDFIGGTLNPILAFLSFMALLYTIKIQTDELKLSREELESTREELKASRIAQQEQSKSLKLQNEATKLQIFENTFFQLVNLFIGIRNEFELEIEIQTHSSKYKYKIIDINEFFTVVKPLEKLLYQGYKVIEVFLKMLRKHKFEYDKFNNIYERFTGTYFGQIYQILKFIDDSNIDNKQRYVNIFRAQFTKYELEFLFYHCLGTIGKRRFKKLVQDYEFFEHIILNVDIKKHLLEYDKRAFGKNENILEAYNNLKKEAL